MISDCVPLSVAAINMLKDKPPGTFVVRDSNSFPGAFGLALKVSVLELSAFTEIGFWGNSSDQSEQGFVSTSDGCAINLTRCYSVEGVIPTV